MIRVKESILGIIKEGIITITTTKNRFKKVIEYQIDVSKIYSGWFGKIDHKRRMWVTESQ